MDELPVSKSNSDNIEEVPTTISSYTSGATGECPMIKSTSGYKQVCSETISTSGMMEDSMVTCLACGKIATHPVILDCFHSLCGNCCEEGSQSKTISPNPGMPAADSDMSISDIEHVCKTDKNNCVGRCISCPFCGHVSYLNNQCSGRKDGFLERYIKSVRVPLSIGGRCGECELVLNTGQFCLDCRMSLCDSCCRQHLQTGVNTANHTITPCPLIIERAFSRMKEHTSTCVTHGEELRYFCMKCSELVCMHCIVASHRKHWSVFQTEALLHLRSDIQRMSSKLRQHHTKTHRLAEALPRHYEKEAETLKLETNSFFEALVNSIHETKRNVLKEIDRNLEETKNRMRPSSAEVRKSCMAATSAHARLKMINRYGSEGDMLDLYSRIKTSNMWSALTDVDTERIDAFSVPNMETSLVQIQQILGQINVKVTHRNVRHCEKVILKHAPGVSNCKIPILKLNDKQDIALGDSMKKGNENKEDDCECKRGPLKENNGGIEEEREGERRVPYDLKDCDQGAM